jgi:protein-S-isoprenylcysteine O-methyltransferase Ste14
MLLLGPGVMALALAFVAPMHRPTARSVVRSRCAHAAPAVLLASPSAEKASGDSADDTGLRSFVRVGMRNLSDGEPGKRGEVYVGIQVAALILVLFGDLPGVPLLRLLHLVLGPLCATTGAVLIVSAIYRLGRSLSPWPIPVKENELQTTGAYGAMRHPMYVGLTMLAVGCATIAQSVPRIVVTALLGLLLRAQAIVEEGLMRDRHGAAWDTYAASTPQFLPAALERLPLGRVKKLWRGDMSD